MLEGLDPEVKAVYLNCESYDTYCLTVLAAHNYAFVVLIVSGVKRSRPNWTRAGAMLSTTISKAKSTVAHMDSRFPGLHQLHLPQGKYDEEGVARHGYAVDALFIKLQLVARRETGC